jgi:hypothetical protein
LCLGFNQPFFPFLAYCLAVRVLLFSILVVAVTPPFFNNNQRLLGAAVFGRLRWLQVAGWLWRIPQADSEPCYVFRQPHEGASCLSQKI